MIAAQTAEVEDVNSPLADSLLQGLDSGVLSALDALFASHQALTLDGAALAIGWKQAPAKLLSVLKLCEGHCRFRVTLDGIVVAVDEAALRLALSERHPSPALYGEVITFLDHLTLQRLDRDLLDAVLFDAVGATDAEILNEDIIVSYGSESQGDRVAAVLLHFPSGGSLQEISRLYARSFPKEKDLVYLEKVLEEDPRFRRVGKADWQAQHSLSNPFIPETLPPQRSIALDLAYAIVRILMEVVKADDILLSKEEEVIAGFFQHEFGYDPDQIKGVWRLNEEARDTKADLSLLCEDLAELEEPLRELLVQTAVQVALADNMLHPAEEIVVLDLIERLELGPTATASILDELHRDHALPPSVTRDFLRLLGLDTGATPLEAREQYQQLLARFHPDALAHHGAEFTVLGERRRRIFQLAFEQLQSDPDYWNETALRPDPQSISLADIPFGEKLKGWFACLRLRTLGDLLSIDTAKLQDTPGFGQAQWDEICNLLGARFPELSESDPGFQKFVTAKARGMSELTTRVAEVLDVVQLPLNQAEIVKRLLVSKFTCTSDEVGTALEHAHLERRVFYCGNGKWANPRHLALPTEKAQQVRQLAVQYLEENEGAELRASELHWRKAAGWTLAPVRVDFALSSCDKLERVKPGQYRLATVVNSEFPAAVTPDLASSTAPTALPTSKSEPKTLTQPTAPQESTENGVLSPTEVLDVEGFLRLSLRDLNPGTRLHNMLRRRGLLSVKEILKVEGFVLVKKTMGFGLGTWTELIQALHLAAKAYPGADDLVSRYEATLDSTTTEVAKDGRSGPPPANRLAFQTPEVPIQAVLNAIDLELGSTRTKVVERRFGLKPGCQVSTYQELGRLLSLDRDRIRELESSALAQLAKHWVVRRFHTQLKEYLEGVSGWQGIELLPKPVWDCSIDTARGVLRLLCKLYSDLSFADPLDIIACDTARLHRLQEAKFTGQQSLPLPLPISRLVEWIRTNLKENIETAYRIVERLWGVVTLPTNSEPVVYAFSQPTKAQEIAALLHVANRPLRPLEIARSMEQTFQGNLPVSGVRAILTSEPRLFLNIDEDRWTLFSLVDTSAITTPEFTGALLALLWIEGKALTTADLVKHAKRHHSNPPKWLNEYSLFAILKLDNRFDTLKELKVQPAGSGFDTRDSPQRVSPQAQAVRECPPQSKQFYDSVPPLAAVAEGNGAPSAADSNLVDGGAGAPAGLAPDSDQVAALRAVEILPRSAVLAVASWWSEYEPKAGHGPAGALLLALHRNKKAFGSLATWANVLGVSTKSLGGSSGMSHASQERLLLLARDALAGLTQEDTQPVCQWWSDWVQIGFLHLGSILLKAAKEGQRPKETLTARVRAPEENIAFDERDMDSPAFFSSRRQGNQMTITVNTNHPAYALIKEALHSLESRAVKLLLAAWATFEQDQPDGVRKDRAGEARLDWGRVTRRAVRDRLFLGSIESAKTDTPSPPPPEIPDSDPKPFATKITERGKEIVPVIAAAALGGCDRQTLLLKAGRLYEQGQLKDAEQIYDQLVTDIPDSNCYFWRGVCRLEQGRYTEALNDYSAAIDLDKSDPKLFNHRGVCFMSLWAYDSARKDFRRAVALDATTAVYKFNEAKALVALRNAPEATIALSLAKHACKDEELLEEINKLEMELRLASLEREFK